MKKARKLLSLLLLLALLMTLGGGLSASAASPEKTAKPESTTKPVAEEKKEDPPEGMYTAFAVQNEGFTVDAAALDLDSTVRLDPDGKGSMTLGKDSIELKFWHSADGEYTIIMADGSETTVRYHDGLLEMPIPGYGGMCLFYAREDADTTDIKVLSREEFLKQYEAAREKPQSKTSKLWESMDTEKGVHLTYERVAEKLDTPEQFDVQGKGELYYSLHTLTAAGKEQQNANCIRDGKLMLLYPKEKKGSVVMEAVPKLITADVMTVDDLYSAIGRRAKELRFTEETREIDGKKYEAEVFPATAFVGESVFCFDTDGKLVYYFEGETDVSAALVGKLSYTVKTIDDKVDETLFDLSAYQLS